MDIPPPDEWKCRWFAGGRSGERVGLVWAVSEVVRIQNREGL